MNGNRKIAKVESNQADREFAAMERLEITQNYQQENTATTFCRIIYLDEFKPLTKFNLLEDADKFSPSSHNQWMVLTAIKFSLMNNLAINKFYFDVDCAKNDCFCDTEISYDCIRPIIDLMSNSIIQLERFRCIPESQSNGNYYMEKKLKIMFLQELNLFNLISYCNASKKYLSSRNQSLEKFKNGYLHPYSCGKCVKCKQYMKAMQLP